MSFEKYTQIYEGEPQGMTVRPPKNIEGDLFSTYPGGGCSLSPFYRGRDRAVLSLEG